jgi:hypothetical protein
MFNITTFLMITVIYPDKRILQSFCSIHLVGTSLHRAVQYCKETMGVEMFFNCALINITNMDLLDLAAKFKRCAIKVIHGHW